MPKMNTRAQTAWAGRAKRVDGLLAKLYKRDWTDDEIAGAIGASFNTVRRWRRGDAVPQGARLKQVEKLVDGVESGAIEKPKPLVA